MIDSLLGISGILHLTPGMLLMWVIGLTLVYLAVARQYEPLLLLPIGFGIVLAPEGATLEYTDRYMRMIEAQLLPLPERNGLFTATGLGFGGPGRVTNGFVFLNLKDRADRERSQQEAYEKLLLDCLRGDQTLFARQDEVESMWRFVAPLLDGAKDGTIPIGSYPAGSPGPELKP